MVYCRWGVSDSFSLQNIRYTFSLVNLTFWPHELRFFEALKTPNNYSLWLGRRDQLRLRPTGGRLGLERSDLPLDVGLAGCLRNFTVKRDGWPLRLGPLVEERGLLKQSCQATKECDDKWEFLRYHRVEISWLCPIFAGELGWQVCVVIFIVLLVFPWLLFESLGSLSAGINLSSKC